MTPVWEGFQQPGTFAHQKKGLAHQCSDEWVRQQNLVSVRQIEKSGILDKL